MNCNYPAFHSVAAWLRDQNMEVINPAELHDGDKTLPFSTYMRTDLPLVMECDGIVRLPGWEQSEGAKLEVSVGSALGLSMFDVEWSPTSERWGWV
jgi:hypothetical protein